MSEEIAAPQPSDPDVGGSGEPLSAAQVATHLRTEPVTLGVVKRAPEEGGIPASSGFYAWWVKAAAIPGLPLTQHPSEPDLELLYVGISPSSSSSAQTLRARILDKHLGGNAGSSTFRFSLAALLMGNLGLRPRKTETKVVLPSPDNKRLSNWQVAHLRLTWCEREAPWKIEDEVIARMQPPLNLASNSGHPFYEPMRAARDGFRRAAQSGAATPQPLDSS